MTLTITLGEASKTVTVSDEAVASIRQWTAARNGGVTDDQAVVEEMARWATDYIQSSVLQVYQTESMLAAQQQMQTAQESWTNAARAAVSIT